MEYKHRAGPGDIAALYDNCKEGRNGSFPENWYNVSYQYYLDHAVPTIEIPNFNKSVPVDVPVVFNETLIMINYRAYKQWLGNYDSSLYYGSGALGYWLLVMIIEGVVNWSKVLFPGLVNKLTFAPISWWRQYVSLPATIRRRRAQLAPLLKFGDFLIPSRYESLVTLGFYVYIIVVHCIEMGYVEGELIFGEKSYFIRRVVADGTGIVATVIMPLVFLYGGRNNFMQWLSGMSYSKFMTYHRHIARVMFLLVFLHSCIYSALVPEEVHDAYYFWGIVATIAGGIIMFQAMFYLRRNWYELFLLTHIVMVAIYICGTWIHLIDLGYGYFCYASIAPWCFDRAVRIGRLVVFGFPQAQVTFLTNGTVNVVIPKPNYWKSVPGSHVFVSFFRPSCFWQSHPFTIIESPDGKSIVLHCKVKGGMTHGLYHYLAKQPSQSASIRVGVEGPYGLPSPAKYSDSAVFIAGGNGIPGLYSEAVDMAKHFSVLTWFEDEFVQLKGSSIQTTIRVTRPETGVPIEETKKFEGKDSTDDDKDSIKSKLSHIEFKEGRPSIEEIVTDEITVSPGSVAFVVCGHPAMVDEVRYYAAHNVRNSEHKRVDCYQQLQVWA
ncbi:putative ferric reductase transmembrane component [Candida viswanathii]|uniref:ferric-chelate reductase (NADPH) n=1 Tax=Candida viswanathii TaxID=5486 RepID=A0A367YJE3_9ASCO|nr:putative ferric reductase transmembrane component [Candida viswanathii]